MHLQELPMGGGVQRTLEKHPEFGQRQGIEVALCDVIRGELSAQSGDLVVRVPIRCLALYCRPGCGHLCFGVELFRARTIRVRQTSTVVAAIDAGKKAYQEEKRKTELSGRIEAAPQYTEKSN